MLLLISIGVVRSISLCPGEAVIILIRGALGYFDARWIWVGVREAVPPSLGWSFQLVLSYSDVILVDAVGETQLRLYHLQSIIDFDLVLSVGEGRSHQANESFDLP